MSKTTSVEGGEFPCGQCDRAFTSRPALTMHINRVHSKKVRVPGQHKDIEAAKEERLVKKREYNRKWRLRKGMKVRPASQKGSSWTPKRRAKFNRTWAAKGKLSRNHEALTLHGELNKEKIPDPRQFINCCPNCGYNLKAHYLAAGFKTP